MPLNLQGVKAGCRAMRRGGSDARLAGAAPLKTTTTTNATPAPQALPARQAAEIHRLVAAQEAAALARCGAIDAHAPFLLPRHGAEADLLAVQALDLLVAGDAHLVGHEDLVGAGPGPVAITGPQPPLDFLA